MKAETTGLPPWWINIPSYFFVLFLSAPLFMVFNILGSGHVGFMGMSLTREDGDSLAWMLILDTLFFASGITALGILLRKAWAYDFGLVYVIAAILIGGAGILTNVGDARSEWLSGATQMTLLLLFGIHLFRHRTAWRNEITTRRRT